MENDKSSLEKYADKLLWKVLSILWKDIVFYESIIDYLRGDDFNLYETPEYSEAAEEIFKKIGIQYDAYNIVDTDYLYELINLNKDKIFNEEFSGTLVRPKLKLFEFYAGVEERQWVYIVYKHDGYFYSKRPIKYIRYDDNFYYYDGKQTHYEVQDSEVNTVEITDIEEKKLNENYQLGKKQELQKLISERKKIDQKIKKLLK